MVLRNNIYIIIVTYNGLDWLPMCLGSSLPYNVVIVDNNSTDGTLNYLKSNYPEITLIPQKVNLGFGKANNIGMEYALENGADYVFLLNQDAYLTDGLVECLINTQKKFPNYGILSPFHLNGAGNLLDRNFSYHIGYDFNKNLYTDYILANLKKEVYSIPFVNAAGWLISKEVLKTVGGFDPIFFHYGEDENYCQRVLYHGFKIGVVPDVFLLHDRESRSKSFIKFQSNEYFKKKEIELKCKFGNINSELSQELAELIVNRKWAIVKNFIKLNFEKFQLYRKEYFLLSKIYTDILTSRRINKSSGANYLNQVTEKDEY